MTEVPDRRVPDSETPQPSKAAPQKSKESKRQRVEARLLRGFRDILPEELIARERMLATIRSVFEMHGFAPLATPALEPLDVLGRSDLEDDSGTGGGSIFRVVDPDNWGEFLGLRFDMTVPLARVVSQYNDLPRPFRRYAVGPVWRVDKPGPGRFREFVQFDLDIVGSEKMEADAEVIACMVETLQALDLDRFRVRINNRKILSAAIAFAAVPDEQREVKVGDRTISYDVRLETLRSLDKFDRVGHTGVAELLGRGRRDETGDFKFGVGLEAASIEKLLAFLRVPNTKRSESLQALRELFGSSAEAEAGIAELEEIDAVLTALGVSDAHAAFDMTIVRGLAYYTGPVFEAVLLDAPEFGSVFSGGRYDGLVQRFQSAELPAVGASVGVDRLLVALDHLKRIEKRSSPTEVLITVMDPTQRNQYLAMAKELRQAGIATEVFLGGRNFGKQLKYADKLGIPIALIAGGDEFARGEVALKDLWAGREVSKQLASFEEWRENPTQITAPRASLVAEVRAMRQRQRSFERKLRGASE